MRWYGMLLVCSVIGLAGCSSDDGGGGATAAAAGTEGGACYGNNTCNGNLTCSASKICVLLDACTGVDCAGHGECSSTGGTAKCTCDTGYHASGLQCLKDGSDPCDGQTCSGFGSCAIASGVAKCTCNTGYHASGLQCIKDAADPCSGQTCSGFGTCVVADAGVAICDCNAGYHADALQCIKDDPCAGQTCSGFGTCEVNNGAAQCKCDAGYRAEGLTCLFGEHTLTGSFVITDNPTSINGQPYSGAFNAVVGDSVTYLIAFNVVSSTKSEGTGIKDLDVLTGPVHVEFTGAGGPDLSKVAASVEGQPLKLKLEVHNGAETGLGTLLGPTAAEYFSLQFTYQNATPTLDGSGYPTFEKTTVAPTFTLSRYVTGAINTDSASGSGTMLIQ